MKTAVIILSVVIVGIIVWIIYQNMKGKNYTKPATVIPSPAKTPYQNCIDNYMGGIVSAQAQCAGLAGSPVTTVITPPPSTVPPDWDANTSYNVGDLVTYQGSVYKCIVAITGIPPVNSTYWTKQ